MSKPIHSPNEKRAGFAGGSSLSQKLENTSCVSCGYPYNSTTPLIKSSTNFIPFAMERAESLAPLLEDTTIMVSDYRRERYEILALIKRILSDMSFRVTSCMKALGNTDIVKEKDGRIHSTNLILCGSIWLCPVCSSRITEVRREELDRAISNNPDKIPVLVTFTLQHDRSDTLKVLLDRLNGTLQKLKTGYFWQQFQKRYKVKAYASSLEITYSQVHGWHPHKHLLFFLEEGADLEGFERDIRAKYLEILSNFGGYGSEFHAVEVSRSRTDTKGYIAKWGITQEFTKANLKKGRLDSLSVWELAMLAEQEPFAWNAYREYAEATYRRKAITWSKGARKVLGLDEELTDEQIAEKEIETESTAEKIATLSSRLWNNIVKDGVQEEVYTVAGQGGIELLVVFLKELRYPILRKGDTLIWTS